MEKLLSKQKVNEGKITALGTQMVSIAQTTLKEIERLQTDIIESNKRLEMVTQCVIMKKLLTKQKVNEGKTTALGTQMVSIVQTTLK